jgi:hypothetical protein
MHSKTNWLGDYYELWGKTGNSAQNRTPLANGIRGIKFIILFRPFIIRNGCFVLRKTLD